jgi:hypothetical protein
VRAGRVVLLALGAASLGAGILGGLARLGAPIPVPAAAGAHGALMVSGFLGTVISLERAVALGMRFAYGAPLASGLALALGLAGFSTASAALLLLAPLLLLGASAAIVRRQPAPHTVLLAVAAGAWAVGNALHVGGLTPLALAWWFAFLVLTIAAERLEMTRLVKRRALARPLFLGATAGLLAGAALGAVDVAAGAVVFGLGLVAIAAWLATFDIARRTVRTAGFSRYAAVALLGGYGWLAVAGAAWALAPSCPQLRDTALHALGLGFVFSMIFAHAPLVVPVVARVRMRFVAFFYVPLALLHASLLARLAAGGLDPAVRLAGGVLNAAAVALFVATLVYAVATAERELAHCAAPAENLRPG